MDPHTENAYEQYAEDSVNEFESESLWSEKHQNLKSYCGGCYEKLKDLMADERAFHPPAPPPKRTVWDHLLQSTL